MRIYLFIIFCTYFFIEKNVAQLHTIDLKNAVVNYETKDGKIEGKYTSYYSNGIKKSEGTFSNNYRAGQWQLWDNKGNLLMTRNYKNPFVYEQKFPPIPNNGPIPLLNTPRYDVTYNNKGFIDFYKVREREVMYSRRLWRMLQPVENKILFENNLMYEVLYKSILNKQFTAYDPGPNNDDDMFTSEFDLGDFKSNIVDAEFSIIAYKIKEDYFFDRNRMVSENQIIGICPVGVNKITKDTLDLFWVYYPEIREAFSKTQINLTSTIKSLDDLFFFRSFYGEIYKESNAKDQEIKEYKKGEDIKKEAVRIEIELIETEHNLWLQLFN